MQLRKQRLPVHPGQIHFVDKYKGGDAVLLQQPPEGQCVGLDPVSAADDPYCAIQDGKGPFGFRSQIRMARGIHQGDLQSVRFQNGLLGKNGDAPLPFQIMGVQKGIPVIHPTQGAFGTGAIQQGFAMGGLAGVNMSQKTDAAWCFQFLCAHKCPPVS